MIARADLTPAYGWNERAHRYVDLSTGRFVPQRAIRQAVDAVIVSARVEMAALAGALNAGHLTLPGWQQLMAAQIQALHAAQAAAARGGWAQLQPSDWAAASRAIERQLGFLQGFAVALETGQQRLGPGVVRRAEAYAEAGRGTYEALRQGVEVERGAREERRELGVADHCATCLFQASLDWRPIGTLLPIGAAECGVNCHCTMEYR